jgi:hypothetical protein
MALIASLPLPLKGGGTDDGDEPVLGLNEIDSTLGGNRPCHLRFACGSYG